MNNKVDVFPQHLSLLSNLTTNYYKDFSIILTSTLNLLMCYAVISSPFCRTIKMLLLKP